MAPRDKTAKSLTRNSLKRELKAVFLCEDFASIRTWQELVNWINEIGFLPLFGNEVEGFSAEEHTSPDYWWSGNRQEAPWEWREIIAATGQMAYGKFFGNKAGFISLEWLPYFVNCRRDGYDFNARWQDGLANRREKPRESWERIFRHVKEMYPKARDEEIQRLIGKAPQNKKMQDNSPKHDFWKWLWGVIFRY